MLLAAAVKRGGDRKGKKSIVVSDDNALPPEIKVLPDDFDLPPEISRNLSSNAQLLAKVPAEWLEAVKNEILQGASVHWPGSFRRRRGLAVTTKAGGPKSGCLVFIWPCKLVNVRPGFWFFPP